eukprot:5234251-Amphidinium_carterae.1
MDQQRPNQRGCSLRPPLHIGRYAACNPAPVMGFNWSMPLALCSMRLAPTLHAKMKTLRAATSIRPELADLRKVKCVAERIFRCRGRLHPY